MKARMHRPLVVGHVLFGQRHQPATPTGPGYGGDDAKTRHSALTQINRDNVAGLELAWQYDTREKGDTQTQPIVIGRILFGYTPSHKTFALDATTGKQLWISIRHGGHRCNAASCTGRMAGRAGFCGRR